MTQVKGRVKVVGEVQQISEKFTKRDLVLELSDEKYVQYVLFQLTGQNVSLADQLMIGDEIEVFYNLRGREWTSPQGEVRYFNTLEAWKVQVVTASSINQVEKPTFTPIKGDVVIDTEEDDLPF